jgi:hypothetical protein
MIARCRNPNASNWPRYGGAGVRVCDRWLDFDTFAWDVGRRPAGHTLDRIDPAGNYEPGNVRWATAAEQRANQRPRSLGLVDTDEAELVRRGEHLRFWHSEFGQ